MSDEQTHWSKYGVIIAAIGLGLFFGEGRVKSVENRLTECNDKLTNLNQSSNIDKPLTTKNYTAQSQNDNRKFQALTDEKNKAQRQVKQLEKQLAEKDKLLQQFKERDLSAPKTFPLRIGESKYVGETMLIFKDYYDNTSIDDECTISIDGTTETWRTSDSKKIRSCILHLTKCNDPSEWSYKCRY